MKKMKIDYSKAYDILNGEEMTIEGYTMDVDDTAGTVIWVGKYETICATPFWEDFPSIAFNVTDNETGVIIKSNDVAWQGLFKSKTEFRKLYYREVENYIKPMNLSPEEKWLRQFKDRIGRFAEQIEEYAMYDEIETFLLEQGIEQDELEPKSSRVKRTMSARMNAIEDAYNALTKAVEKLSNLAE